MGGRTTWSTVVMSAITTAPSAPTIPLPAPPERPRPSPAPVVTVAAAAAAAAAGTHALGSAGPAIGGVVAGVVLAVFGGWLTDRVLGSGLAARRERRRFAAALDEVEHEVGGLRAARRRELDDWYPTADRLGAAEGSLPRTSALVLGRGRASSGIVLDGRPEDGLRADDPSRARLESLRSAAAVLDEAPLCVPLGSSVRVVGAPVVADSVAAGLRRQLRLAGASRAQAEQVITTVHSSPFRSVGAVAAGDADRDASAGHLPTVDTIIVIGRDGQAVVTRKDGRPCRQPLRVAFVSVVEPAG